MSYRRIRMDDLFEALEMMIEDLQNDFEESFKEFENFGNEARPLMYGFTMTMDHAGEPVIKTFGDKEIKTFFFGGEGLVCRFKGQGRVWIQTRHPTASAQWTFPFRPTKNN